MSLSNQAIVSDTERVNIYDLMSYLLFNVILIILT